MYIKVMKRKRPILWFIFILVFTFVVAFGFGLMAETFFNVSNVLVSCAIILFLMLLAFMGDIVAVSVAYAELPPFNAMASRKIRGAKACIKLIQNSDKVSSILSDVLGDVCGIVCGVVGASLSLVLTEGLVEGFGRVLIVATVTAVIAALTVAVKSLAKKIAIKNCQNIVFAVGKFLGFFTRK